MSTISLNFNLPNSIMNNIIHYIENNDGDCPNGKKCLCEEFRNNIDSGTCECGLFIKEETNL